MARISDERVAEATGRRRQEWFDLLDERGARELDHKAIVAALREEGLASGWWQQSVAVAYEQHIGRRIEGQTADAGFQVGVQKKVGRPAEELWQLLTTEPELWLDGVSSLPLDVGGMVCGVDGTQYDVRGVEHATRLRLRMTPPKGRCPSTLQVYLAPAAGNATSLRIHHEGLTSSEEREAMRAHWREVLSRIAQR